MKLKPNLVFLLLMFWSMLFYLHANSLLANQFPLQLTSLAFLLFVPGILIQLIIRYRFVDFWQTAPASLGFSLVYNYAIGALSSVILPFIGISRPLDKENITLVYSISILIMLIIAAIRILKNVRTHPDSNNWLLDSTLFLFATLVGSIGIAAANLLNSNFSNFLALAVVFSGGVTLYVLNVIKPFNIIRYKPFFLFAASLSLLWLLAGRSNHLTGWDIVQELFVANNVLIDGVWNLSKISDAYQACLSISVLPTVLSNISTFPIEILFKFVYPFIFAFFPVITYKFLSKQLSERFAFIGVFYMIAQPFFIQPMVALARQEIGFVFFSLFLSSVFDNLQSTNTKRTTVILFIFGLVTSHYSTSYLTIAIVTLVYTLLVLVSALRMLSKTNKSFLFNPFKHWLSIGTSSLKGWMVIGLVATTYVWYFLITHSAGGVTKTFLDSIAKMKQLFDGEQESQEVRQALPGERFILSTTDEQLKYMNSYFDGTQLNISADVLKMISAKYPLIPREPSYITPITSPAISSASHALLDRLKDALKIFLLIGVVVLVIKSFRHTTDNHEFILFCGVSMLLLLIMILHPTLGLRYNLSRFYLQTLVLLSAPVVVGLESLFFMMKVRLKNILSTSIVLVVFLYLHGALTPIIGGIPTLHLYNSGTDFSKFYVTEGEIGSATWLLAQRDFKNTVYADDFSGLRIRQVGLFFPNNTILPTVIADNAESYVYLSRSNYQEQFAQVYFDNKLLTYFYPLGFLDEYKGKIYSNHHSVIFK